MQTNCCPLKVVDIIKKTIAIILFIAVSVILLSCEKENPEHGLSSDNSQPAVDQEQSTDNKSTTNVSSLKALEGKWMRSAFSVSPQNFLFFRCCFTYLKNSYTDQRFL